MSTFGKNIQFLSILLLAVSSNLDNVGVGTAYGVRKIRIPFSSNILIALITSTGTWLSMLMGKSIGMMLNTQLAGYLGASIIIAVGLWIFLSETGIVREKRSYDLSEANDRPDISGKHIFKKIYIILDNPFAADSDFSGHISLKEGVLLGFALTLNNLANGVGAGMMGLDIELATIFVGIFSIITIWVGLAAGCKGSFLLGKLAGPVSGLLLILIGVIEFLT
jgi:putative sporulation protein YtaF